MKRIYVWTFIKQPNKPGQKTWKPAGTNNTSVDVTFFGILLIVIQIIRLSIILIFLTNKPFWNQFSNLKEPIFSKMFYIFRFAKLIDCKLLAKYISQFQDIINELYSFSSKFTLDKNFLIYCFQSKLELDHFNYFKWYTQADKFFMEESEIKYIIRSAMQHFRNTLKTFGTRDIFSQIQIVIPTE